MNAFKKRFWCINVDKPGNIFKMDTKSSEVKALALELLRKDLLSKGVDISGLPL